MAVCKPNFFIVGAPKSGTTSLYHYLSLHPDVFMSSSKEPCFLAPDFFCSHYPQVEEQYLRCFEGYQGEKRVGEATSTYLYSKLAARTIHDYAPDAKVIAMLRNPVELVASLHAQRLKEGDECFRNLENALEAEADRRQGRNIPRGFDYPIEYLLYRDFGQYSCQLKRYYSIFGRDRVHIIIFDDFIRNTEHEFHKVCDFLGVSRRAGIPYTPHNAAQIPRFILIHRSLVVLTRALISVGTKVRRFLPNPLVKVSWRTYIWFKHQVKKSNLMSGRETVSDGTRESLTLFYRKEIDDLEKLLGRDLSYWRKNMTAPSLQRQKAATNCSAQYDIP